MAMNVAVKPTISEEAYLQGELTSEIKHEFIDGEIFAMAGASKNHERISGNVYRKIGNFLDTSSCEPFSSDVKVKVGMNFFYPDVMVVCNEQTEHPYYSESPTILVEVLSSSTRRIDQTIKRISYQSIPSLREYLLIEQDFVDVEVCRKNHGWLPQHYFLGDEFSLDSIGIKLAVVDIYQRVQNEDVLSYLQQLAEANAAK